MAEYQELPPARPVGGTLARIFKMAAGPRRLEPRKGGDPNGLQPIHWFGRGPKPVEQSWIVPTPALKELAERDDIIAAIRRTLRFAIGELDWKIVPDLDAVKADLKTWQTIVEVNLAQPGLDLEFTPNAMSLRILEKARGTLRDILREILQAGENPAMDHRLRDFFDNIINAHEAIARTHIAQVQAIFEKPNPSAESSFRALLSLLIDDLTLYDGAALVKNVTLNGKLGELYTIPGHQVRVYRKPDRSTPQPPNVAYDWVDDTKVKAYYNNVELVYMMANPQQDGYGKSPISSIIETMAGTIYARAFMVDAFANNNMPNFVFDLGPNVSQPEKDAVEAQWEERVRQGRHRGIFIANKDGVKGFMPLEERTDNDDSTLDKLKYWANVKVAQYNLSLNDIGFTEDLHRTTSEVQQDLTQSRGIMSFAKIIAGFLNSEVVQGEMFVRDDPENPNGLEGTVVPCFPFRDVKFQFADNEDEARIDRAEKLSGFVDNGVLTRNEMRKELDYPPVKGGDTLVIMSGGSPLKVEDLPNIPPPQQPPQPGMPGDPNAMQPGASQDGTPPGGTQLPNGGSSPQRMLPSGHPPAKPGAQQLALPLPGQPQPNVQKAVESVQRLADSLRKMADERT